MARLGELLVQQNLISQDTIDAALRVQVGGNRRIGHILVRMKAITADQLAETLAVQMEIPILSIAEKFSSEAKDTLPRYLCRQYDVLPLALKENNILEMAMSNPADEGAIGDLENYTGKVIEPALAKSSDINREINRRIPLSVKDFITPQTNVWVTRAAAALSLCLVVWLVFFTYDYVQKDRYGTVSITDSHVLLKNNDLILGVDKTGKISLLGHGAFSEGFYSVSFDTPEGFKAFVQNRKADFSEKQRKWLDWAIEKANSDSLTSQIVVNN